ncbi:hypothetical protein KKD20_06290 [Patescibacteria group bacterium]|nr:hypothetical protein [Patescibacteria group bacterium]
MMFAKEMKDAADYLVSQGHQVFLPEFVEDIVSGKQDINKIKEYAEHADLKIEHNLIRKHWEKMKQSDATLVLNHDRKGVKNYIGGNTFLEMGFAHVLNLPIYLINPIPEMAYSDEIKAMEPIVLDGDLGRIL